MRGGEEVEVDLLRAVDGYFLPFTMTALMGSSGAGKTTLLDVLAGRKNTGTVRGKIFLNGVPKQDEYFRKIMGYVEQFDSLPGKATAREAISFSAALRLDGSVTTTQRLAFVDNVLGMLDLLPLQNHMIGDMAAGGMSFEQRKRVSIGVELAANPAILFLDEPTTGLDSRAAQALIGHIRRIASSGRTVVCTIHQPSSALFESFDNLLLLRRGGQTVFFGGLGLHAVHLKTFFEACPGVTPLSTSTNPATWMLEIIGAGTSKGKSKEDSADSATGESNVIVIDHNQYYLQSALYARNKDALKYYTTPNEGSEILPEPEDGYPTSSWTQFVELFTRMNRTYWRSPTYSLGRIGVNILLALIFASAYPKQEYTTYVAAISRAGVIFITTLFCGILSLITTIPVMSAERLVFYREQQSRMYQVWIYTLTTVLIEVIFLPIFLIY